MDNKELRELVDKHISDDGLMGDMQRDCLIEDMKKLIKQQKTQIIDGIITEFMPDWSDHNSYNDNIVARLKSELKNYLKDLKNQL